VSAQHRNKSQVKHPGSQLSKWTLIRIAQSCHGQHQGCVLWCKW